MKTPCAIRTALCAAICLLSHADAQPFHTNLTNGSFESGFDDWTVTGNVSIETTGNPAAPYAPTDGNKLAAFNAVNSAPNGVLSRTLAVPNTILRKHRLRFDAGNLGFIAHDMKLHVEVEVDGTTSVDADIIVPGTTGGATRWIACEYEFPTPITGTVTLTFTDVSTDTTAADLLLDHVRVDDSRYLEIQSSGDYPNPGVPISVSPADADHLGNGTTSFTRQYYPGDVVTLTAPSTRESGKAFREWVQNGASFANTPSVGVTIGEDLVMKAVYQPGINVTPNSGADLKIEGFAGCGPFTPLIADYQIHNESAAAVDWSAALDIAATPWLRVWPSGGTLAPGEQRVVKFLVTSDVTALPAGMLESRVRFTTPGGTFDVPVSILIRDPEKVAVNGSFESGFDSWTATGNISLQSGAPYSAPDGSSLVAFNAVNSNPDGVVKQTLRTETGVRYFLDFDAGTLAYNTNEQRLRLRVRDAVNSGNSLMVDSVFSIFGAGGGSNAWTARHYEFTATADLTEISFSDESNQTTDIDLLLDHVRVYNPAYRLTVTTSADENDPAIGIGSGNSLRETVAEAARVPGGNRITFSDPVQIANLPAPLSVNSAVGIDTAGHDVTLNAYGFPGGLDVSAPACMRHLILTGNTQSAIRNTSDLMLLDSHVAENSSTTAGAGILNTAAFSGPSFTEGILVADRCTIARNHSTILGGGFGSFGDVLLTRTTLDSNTSDGNGGALANGSAFGGNWIMLDACTVSRNTAGGSGGGFSGVTGYKSFGHLEAVNSTFFENTAVTSGGGILTNGPVNLLHCTVSQNSCPTGQGGGMMETGTYGWTANLANSIVAGNTAATDPDLSGPSPALRGNNLTTGDPMLSYPHNAGGDTEFLPPSPASPAVNAAMTLPESPASDQRGRARVSGTAADLGAVELKELLVNTLADENDGIATGAVSLRDAIMANSTEGADLIRFSPSLNGGTIRLVNGVIGVVADYSLYVDASDLSDGIAVSGNHQSAVFNFIFSITTLRGLTITESFGSAVESFTGYLELNDCILRNNTTPYNGGALVVDDPYNGSASITRCLFDRNSASGNGGAVFNRSLLHITDSTFTGNHCGGNGGAIISGIYRVGMRIGNSTFSGNSADNGGAIAGASLRLFHCTLSENQASNAGGGLLSTSTIPNPELGLSLSNTIIAGNTASTDSDVSGPIDGQSGMNLIGGNPKLAPLDDYGGPTPTMPPLPGSPAIEAAILLENTPPADQRGVTRPFGTAPDIGAVEAFPFASLALVDTDGDTIDDRLEPAYGLVVGIDDSTRDTDGDGSADGEEIANMTDPSDPNSLLRVLSIAPLPGDHRFRVIFTSFPGLDYTMECDQNLDFHGPNARAFPLGTAGSTTGQVDVDLLPGRDFVRIRRDP